MTKTHFQTVSCAALAVALSVGAASSPAGAQARSASPRERAASAQRCGTEPVFFGTGSAALDRNARSQLGELSGCLRRSPPGALTVIGRADARGTGARNRVLSKRRALAVLEYLRHQGVRVQRFEVLPAGEDEATPTRELLPYGRTVSVLVRPR